MCIIKKKLKTYRVKKRTSSAQHGRVLNTSLYIPLKLNEPGYDVSVMRMLKNWQWKQNSFDFLFSMITHIIRIFDNRKNVLQKQLPMQPGWL